MKSVRSKEQKIWKKANPLTYASKSRRLRSLIATDIIMAFPEQESFCIVFSVKGCLQERRWNSVSFLKKTSLCLGVLM